MSSIIDFGFYADIEYICIDNTYIHAYVCSNMPFL